MFLRVKHNFSFFLIESIHIILPRADTRTHLRTRTRYLLRITMSAILEKIATIELEMSRTQKNKATENHLGSLRAKLAQLRRELIEPSGKSGGKGEGFDVTKTGDCRVGLVGFPSVGKSTLLTKLTGVHSEAAAYEFTTLTCVPGCLLYTSPSPRDVEESRMPSSA